MNKLRSVITAVLLLFVVVSVVALITKDKPVKQPADQTETDTPAEQVGTSTDEQGAAGDTEEVTENKEAETHTPVVMAYYFHGNKRCPTCRKIEKYTGEAIATEFSGFVEAGDLVWKVVNIDFPNNEHFWEDYKLPGSSVVLVRYEKGEEAEYKTLDDVWKLTDDEVAFKEYIVKETQQYL